MREGEHNVHETIKGEVTQCVLDNWVKENLQVLTLGFHSNTARNFMWSLSFA